MSGKHEVHGRTAETVQSFTLGSNHHAVRCGSGAGGQGSFFPVNFHHAELTATLRSQVRVRAQVWNVDASFQGRIENGGAFLALHLDAIDHKFNLSHDQIPLSF
jgi:hypothetical protein